jgi:superfamily II DNA/RNA helicase
VSTSTTAAPSPRSHRPAAPQPCSFAELGVPARLVAALAAGGITEPFPVQAATLPDALAGRDILGRARTGSGKTVAFAVPVAAVLAASARPRRRNAPRAVVLLPTRELAGQVAKTLAPLAAAVDLTVATVFGGVPHRPQIAALGRGVDILVACPGRLEDLIALGHCRLDAIEVTVLDEADHMADQGFLPAMRRLLDATPADTQRLLFSATLDRDVDVLVRRYLRRPAVHSVDPIEVASDATITHHLLEVAPGDKHVVVQSLAAADGRSILFTRTKRAASKLARRLSEGGVPAVDLHGNLSQGARDRNLAAFASGRVEVLVATDIAARGIHVGGVARVVHVDPPAEHKAYLHRSGRTARAGADGVVITVATPDQSVGLRTLARKAGIHAVVERVTPGDERLASLTTADGDYGAVSAPSPSKASRARSRRSVARSAAFMRSRHSSST